MTLEDLGNIGEFVAAIGVIVSLLYVAVQLRQNTRQIAEGNRAMRLTEMQATAQAFSHFREMVVPNPEVSELLQRGGEQPETLGPADLMRFSLMMQELFFSCQALYQRCEEGLMPRRSWEGTARMLAGLLGNPGIAEWWQRDQGLFDPRFVEALGPSRSAGPEVPGPARAGGAS